MSRLDFGTVKQAAAGQWRWVLVSLGVEEERLRNRHGPCPGCGGRDRFRFADRDGDGEWYCSQGGGSTGGDGFGLLCHCFGWSPGEALKRVAEVLGLETDRAVSDEERQRWAAARVAAARREEERGQGLALLQELDLLACRLRRRYLGNDRPVVPGAPVAVDERARRVWGAAAESGTSTYLERKQVPGVGVRYGQEGLLLVPVRDLGGRWMGIQFIAEDGSKKYLTGTPKRGGMHLMGEAVTARPVLHAGEEGRGGWVEYPTSPAVIAVGEGYATVATVHQAMGWPGVVAFDSGNLPGVAAAVAYRWPGAWIVVLGDFDGHQSPDGHPGVAAAVAAAEACGGVAVWQCVPDGQGWDWNDVLVREGPEILRELLAARLAEAKAAAGEREREAAARAQALLAARYGRLTA